MPIENPYSSRQLSRRQTLGLTSKGILLAALAFKFGRLPWGNNPDAPDYTSISDLQKEELAQHRFSTIAHNGGDDPRFYPEFAATSCDFIEVDIQESGGKLFVKHSRDKEGIGLEAIYEPFLPGKVFATFPRVARMIREDGKKLFIDFKNGSAPKPTYEFLEKEGMLANVSFTSGAWSDLNTIRDLQNGNCSNLYYTISSDENFNKFMEYVDFPKGSFGVSMHEDVASKENIAIIKSRGGRVFAYPISDSFEALRVLRNGANGLITSDIELLNFNPTNL